MLTDELVKLSHTPTLHTFVSELIFCRLEFRSFHPGNDFAQRELSRSRSRTEARLNPLDYFFPISSKIFFFTSAIFNTS